jgi:hypothetical protein
MKYSYGSIYNMRPGELYGMGKESLTVKGEATLEEFIKLLEHNSSLKHEDCKEYIIGTDEWVEVEEWKPWIGQPMFFTVDIKVWE